MNTTMRTLLCVAAMACCVAPSIATQNPEPTSAQRETATLAFARQHHPELATLLEALREKRESSFREALAEVEGSMRQLVRMQRRSSEAYPHALEAWKLRSRARLLAARLKRKWSDEGLAELRNLLLKAEQSRRLVWAIQAEKLQQNAERLRARAASDPTQSADRELKNLRRKLRRDGKNPQEQKR